MQIKTIIKCPTTKVYRMYDHRGNIVLMYKELAKYGT